MAATSAAASALAVAEHSIRCDSYHRPPWNSGWLTGNGSFSKKHACSHQLPNENGIPPSPFKTA
jgi:hypothetical protein